MEFIELNRHLPLGESSFSALRRQNKIYVDKTDLVLSLASSVQKIFLARPRRFGKSLLVSTFESLFKYGLRDFKGLAIEKKWRDNGTYNIIRLDLSRIKKFSNIEEFRFKLNDYLQTAFSIASFTFPQDFETVASNFEIWVTRCEPQSIVLLIDEYDAPLTAVLDQPHLFKAARDELFEFFTVIKSQTEFFRFVFMTGITKFSQTGIFSELNDFSDISLSQPYATLLGYTREELLHYFCEHLAEAGKILDLPVEQIVNELAETYDGYCFDGLSGAPHEPTRVYTPWSVLNFLRTPQDGFRNYWMTSGGKTQLLTQYFKEHSLKSPEEYGAEKLVAFADLDGSSDLDTINDVALLTQAGYLTIKSRVSRNTLLVGYPNREVSESMAVLYANMLLEKKSMDDAGAVAFSQGLLRGDSECVMREINRIFLAINYERYPVRNESAVQACLQVFASGAGFNAIVEKHNAFGRSDLELDAGDFHWVFELKYLPESANDDADRHLLEEAKTQIIDRHYGRTCRKRLLCVAAVFSASQRQFSQWSLVPASMPQTSCI